MFPLPIRLVMRVRSVAPMVQRMMSWMMSWMMHGEDKKVTPGKSLEDINKVRGARPKNERLARSEGFHVLCIGKGVCVRGAPCRVSRVVSWLLKRPMCVGGRGPGGRGKVRTLGLRRNASPMRFSSSCDREQAPLLFVDWMDYLL